MRTAGPRQSTYLDYYTWGGDTVSVDNDRLTTKIVEDSLYCIVYDHLVLVTLSLFLVCFGHRKNVMHVV